MATASRRSRSATACVPPDDGDRRHRDRRPAAAVRRGARHRLRVARGDGRAARAGRRPAGQPPARHRVLRRRPPRGRGPHDPADRHGYESYRTAFSLSAPGPRTNRPVARTMRPQPAGRPRPRSAPTSATPSSTATCGCSAASPPAATSRPAPTRATSRSSTGRRSTTSAATSSATTPRRHEAAARQLSLSFLHWLQTACRACPACVCAATSSATARRAAPRRSTCASRAASAAS